MAYFGVHGTRASFEKFAVGRGRGKHNFASFGPAAYFYLLSRDQAKNAPWLLEASRCGTGPRAKQCLIFAAITADHPLNTDNAQDWAYWQKATAGRRSAEKRGGPEAEREFIADYLQRGGYDPALLNFGRNEIAVYDPDRIRIVGIQPVKK